MDASGSLSLEESLLNEIYNPANSKRKQVKKVRYPPTLESLDTSFKSFGVSQSTNDLVALNTGGGTVSMPSSTRSLKPLPFNDFHRVSDLMHRVSAVSGYAPDQAETSPINKSIPSASVEIAANMQEYQLKAMKDSNALRETMDQVIQLHQQLENLVTVHLTHRKELSKQIEDINNGYIKLFELSLSEMLKTQRQKFKSQTSDLERLKAEVATLEEKLSAATKTAEMQSEKIVNLRSALFETDENLAIAKEEITILRQGKAKSDHERHEFEERLCNAVGNVRLDAENKIKKLKLEHQQELSTERLKFAEERLKFTQKQQTATGNMEKMTQELAILREKAKALDSLATSVQQRRPLRDNHCQTQVTDAGLWDKQDGWVMPISQTARIRNLWRAGMKFAACRACRGIGKYVHQVGAILRRVQRGKEMIKETVVEEDLSKWCLPDECVRFMSNLPKTAQAFRPHNLAWTVRCVFYFFALKYAADREDDALGYLRQPFVDFVIERYLMSTEHRADAELRMYHLMRSVREFYPRHAAVQLFARFLGVLDAVTPEEYAIIQHKQSQNEAALKRKREEGLQKMGARERVKHIKDAERQQEIDTVFKNPESTFVITTRSLSMDILSIMLYARNCLLHAPYMGVYAVPIAMAKRHSSMQQMQAHQLRILPPSTFSANTIIPEVYDPEYAQTHPGPACVVLPADDPAARAAGSVTKDTVPLHLCIGDKSQHWVPMDRAVAVVKQLLYFLPNEEMTTVYRAMEFNTMFLMKNGTLDLPEGTHSLIRSTIRLFATSPVEGGFDLSWHDLYHSVADIGNQNEYSAHFIKSVAEKETIVPVPDPIVVPIVGSMEQKRAAVESDDEGSHGDDDAEEEDEVVIVRRLCYTRHPAASYMDRSMSWMDYESACAAAGTAPTTGTAWQESYGPRPSAKKIVIQEDLLGNHPHLKHYHHLHPETMMVNLDATLQVLCEAMLNKSASVGERIRQIFIEGDTNHDGVLSFSEFMDIVKKVAPEYPERKILKMFREALMKGDDNECIGPEAFLEVCTAYGLIKILDIHSMAKNQLRALSDPPIESAQHVSVIRTELPRDKSGKVNPSYLKSPKKERRQSTMSLDPKVTRASFMGIEQLPSPSIKQPVQSKPSPSSKLPSQTAEPPPAAATTATAAATSVKTKARNPLLRRSMEVVVSESIPEMDETETHAPPPAPTPTVAVKDATPQNSAKIPAQVSMSGLRFAGLGDVIVASAADKERIIPKQPVKGRAGLHDSRSTGALSMVGGASAALAQEVQGSAAPMQARKSLSLSELRDRAAANSKPRLELSDDIDTPTQSPKKPPHTMHVVVPSPPKIQPALADLQEGELEEEIEEEPRMFALDPVLAEVRYAEVRGVRLNETMSKEGANKILEQLKAKRESRTKGNI